MKKTFFVSLFFLGLISQAQVGIRTANPKATLDVTAHDLSVPTFGIKRADGNASWDNIWFKIDASAPSINASGAETGLQFNVGKNITGTYGDNGQVLTTVATMTPDGNMGIGTATPPSTAILDLTSTSKGFLPPRMTQVQRDAITPKPEGLVIYNLDTHCLQFWNATEWIGNCTNNGGPGTNPGSGTITNCTSGTLSGTYKAGTAMNSSNTVVITVNVTQVGSMTVTSNNVNGVTFSGTQNFTSTGSQQMTLTANGTPSAAGNFNYTFNLGSSTCTRSITFSTDSTGPGGGTIVNCTSGTLSGNYTRGTAMNSGNTVVISVNVTQTGSYSISSSTVNGVSFSGSGNFTSTGTQNVTLTASGTPANSGNFSFPFTFGSSTCSRTITFDGGTPSSVCQFGPGNMPSSYTTAAGKIVTFSVNHDGATGNTPFEGCFTGQNSISMNSYWLLGFKGGANYSSTTTTVSFNRPMNNAVIALSELDAGANGGAQSVTITATDANGNTVPVTLSRTRDCLGNNTINGNTVSQTGTGAGSERNTSLSIRVAGNAYYRSIRIVHNGVKGTYRPETNNATAMNVELCDAVAQ